MKLIFQHWFLTCCGAMGLLSACGLPDGGQSAAEQRERLHGQLVLWISFQESQWTEAIVTEFKQNVTAAVEEFTEIYEDVDLVLEYVPTKQHVDAFITQVNSGFGPDLVLTRASNIPTLTQAGVLQDLSDHELDVAAFRPEALRQVHFQGKLYGWPLFLHTQVLCYNKTKVKQLPKTLLDLRSQARSGYSVGLVSDFRSTFWGTQIFSGQLLDSKDRAILGPGWAQWMEWLKSTKDEPNFVLSDDAPALQDAFLEGRLAYLICQSGWIPTFRKKLGKQQFGVALLPGNPQRSAGPALEPSALVFNRVSSENQTQLAYKFANFFTNVAKQRELATAFQSLIPVNTKVDIDPRLFPILGVLQQQSQTGIAMPLKMRYQLQDAYRFADTLYDQVLAGELLPAIAADRLVERLNAELHNTSE